MKIIALTAAFVLSISALPLWAADSAVPTPAAKSAPVPAASPAAAPAKKTLTKQQQKMKDCNNEAKVKAIKGQDRKAFMKKCLSAE
ncbi:exported hypothetical protein [Gammaproteobacteria bacterium]